MQPPISRSFGSFLVIRRSSQPVTAKPSQAPTHTRPNQTRPGQARRPDQPPTPSQFDFKCECAKPLCHRRPFCPTVKPNSSENHCLIGKHSLKGKPYLRRKPLWNKNDLPKQRLKHTTSYIYIYIYMYMYMYMYTNINIIDTNVHIYI